MSWRELIAEQRTPRTFKPVEEIWRQYGWKPPSTECEDTIEKHKAFRAWSLGELVVDHQGSQEQ
jgi:hypothetical protein